ncbi:hypothetical protein, partial [Gemella morbillorum]|uniref:hypothetical protein n=1 Tax=Gemella morbillorum TaxID=29391 RepID=UPI0023F3D050
FFFVNSFFKTFLTYLKMTLSFFKAFPILPSTFPFVKVVSSFFLTFVFYSFKQHCLLIISSIKIQKIELPKS